MTGSKPVGVMPVCQQLYGRFCYYMTYDSTCDVFISLAGALAGMIAADIELLRFEGSNTEHLS